MPLTPRQRSFRLLAALIALKTALMLIDGRPSVFMGDSGAYLYTAIHDYIPHDRGFMYGFLLRPLAVWPHSLRFLLFAQTVMSAISAWLISVVLTTHFAVPFRRAALLSFLCALEPLQLISERYVMTDTLALFLFAALVTISVAFLRHCSQSRLAAALVIGVALISIRMSYLPIVLLSSLLLPLTWFLRSKAMRTFRAWGLLLLWLGAGQLLLYGYRCLNASVCQMARPEYLYADGFILLAEVSPIVTWSDFPASVPGRRILAAVGAASLSDPTKREGQLFAPNGLCATLHRFIPDEYEANKVAGRIALRAIMAHPGDLTRLAVGTWEGFFDLPVIRESIAYDEGGLRRGEDYVRAEILKTVGTDLGAQSSTGPVWRWHRMAIPWYWFLVVAPLSIPVIFLSGWRRLVAPAALIYGYLIVLFAQTIVVSTHPEPRYLMPIAWLAFLSFGILSNLPVKPLSQTTGAPEALPALAD